MPTFIGFSTQQADAVRDTQQVASGVDGGAGSITKPIQITKKFRTVDAQLVVQDLINALNIPQGQKPGRPDYGTTLWSFVFEPNTLDVQMALETEIRRIAGLDPRLILNLVTVYPNENGILVEVEFAVSPFNDVQTLQLMFDQQTTKAFSI
jgi:phage baseplate assembly protein W